MRSIIALTSLVTFWPMAAAADDERPDFRCLGTMETDVVRTFSAVLTNKREPHPQYLTLTELERADDATVLLEGPVGASLVMGPRGVTLYVHRPALHMEIYLSDADATSYTYPAYLAFDGEAGVVVVNDLKCKVDGWG